MMSSAEKVTRLRLSVISAVAIVTVAFLAHGRERKEYDSDVNYDEAKIPHYDLPPLLVTAEGKEVKTAEEWRSVRRPQILSLFSNLVYGRVPEPTVPIKTSHSVMETDAEYLDGKATLRKVRIEFSNENGKAAIGLSLTIPNGDGKPYPVFMKLGGAPTRELVERGYAVASVSHDDFVAHNEVEFLTSIHSLFFKKGQSFPKAREWGVLSAIAWGHSRVLDYLETVDGVDAKRVAVMGHSKRGKAALWTAAQDQRFALTISAQSGCAGAALWRRRSGETLQKMVTRFPYWLCRNAWKFVNQEDDLPVDQHMLLALIAPRPVYVASGIDDTWADPRGEYASAFHASPVYELLGKKGITSEKLPPLGEAIIESDIGYHVREGAHSVDEYDWLRFADFMDYHFKR